jgi:hypothetical protein
VIDDGVVYAGVSSADELVSLTPTFRGSVVALSARTGQVLWQTYTAPPGYTGNSVWGSTPVVDHTTGLVYVATGNNYTVPAGVCQTPVQTGCAPPAADDYQRPGDGPPRRRSEERHLLGSQSGHRRGRVENTGRPGRPGRRHPVGLGHGRDAHLRGDL